MVRFYLEIGSYHNRAQLIQIDFKRFDDDCNILRINVSNIMFLARLQMYASFESDAAWIIKHEFSPSLSQFILFFLLCMCSQSTYLSFDCMNLSSFWAPCLYLFCLNCLEWAGCAVGCHKYCLCLSLLEHCFYRSNNFILLEQFSERCYSLSMWSSKTKRTIKTNFYTKLST